MNEMLSIPLFHVEYNLSNRYSRASSVFDLPTQLFLRNGFFIEKAMLLSYRIQVATGPNED